MTSIAGAFVINGELVVQVDAQDEVLPVSPLLPLEMGEHNCIPSLFQSCRR